MYITFPGADLSKRKILTSSEIALVKKTLIKIVGPLNWRSFNLAIKLPFAKLAKYKGFTVFDIHVCKL